MMHGARRLYGLAAAQGHANAQCTLGFMHAEGKGGPQNLPEARRLSGLAAAQGHKRAMSEAERLANAMAEALLAEDVRRRWRPRLKSKPKPTRPRQQTP
jgi:TPR repeat protein